MSREIAIRTLLAAIDDYLSDFDGPGIAEVRAGLARRKDDPLQDVSPRRIEPVRHVDTALAAMRSDSRVSRRAMT